MSLSQNSMLSKIGEIFVKKGDLTVEQVSLVLKHQKNTRKLFGQLAVNLGFLKEDNLTKVLSKIYSIKIVSLEFAYIDANTLSSLPQNISEFACAISFYIDKTTVKIAMADPGDVEYIDKINSHFKNLNVEFYIGKESEILRFIEIAKNKSTTLKEDPLLFLNKVIFDAIESKASDVHFEPYENFINIRFRIDGELKGYDAIVFEMWNRIKSRLKVISKLDIAESRKPQSGHTQIYLGGKSVDLRISTHPGQFGENIAIRIFDLSNGIKSLDELGFSQDDCRWLKNAISAPSGIFLVVGPTGSGKTSTLYSLLQEIKSRSANIMTLEDPIEYQMEGVKQLELKENGLLTYADGIRSILRQDPDVMLIGEIRDEETASMAIRAALTGRLVLATLHAYNSTDALRRLMNLGTSLDDCISSLVGIFSQRLLKFANDENTDGHSGRFPITEYMSFPKQVKNKILEEQNITSCKPDKALLSSATESLKNKMTNVNEIKKVLGNVDI